MTKQYYLSYLIKADTFDLLLCKQQ